MKKWFSTVCGILILGCIVVDGCERIVENQSDVDISIVPNDSLPPTLVHWKKKSPMPTARQDVAYATSADKIYVLGGLDSLGHTVNKNEVYDPLNDTWSSGSPTPFAVNHASAVAVKGKIYVIGGSLTYPIEPEKITMEYDPGNDRWTRKADAPYPRAAMAAASLGDSIFVFGGVGSNIRSVLKYVPTIDTWTIESSQLPTPREHLTASAAYGMIYVIGGRNEEQNLGTVEAYSPLDDYWMNFNPAGIRRSSIASAAIGKNIYVVGGETEGVSVNIDNMIFDTVGNQWLKKAPMLTQHYGLACSAVNGKVYVIGGGAMVGISPSRENEEYTP
jgi:N-acetylneuraminic acid mutarotase